MSQDYLNDDWDGFDGRQVNYSAREDRDYDMRIWWVLAIISVLVLISLVVRCVKNDYEAHHLPYVLATETEADGDTVTYHMPNGEKRWLNMYSWNVYKEDGQVMLFYEDDKMSNVHTIDNLMSWIYYYVFFIALGTFSICRLISIDRSYKKETKNDDEG